MTFSIIIPVYNVEKYLRPCLDSVLNQSYKDDYEIVCVNDGSTDGSLNILKEYAKKHANILLINQQNGGTSSARNAGIKVAKGEYVWFVDSDDWIAENSLNILHENLIDKNPDILGFNGKLIYEVDGREEQDEGVTEENLTGWEYYNKYALIPRKIHFLCVVKRIYRRDFLLENNLFFHVKMSHEDNLWVPLVMYVAKSIAVIPAALYNYRIRSGSKMQSPNPQRIFDIINVANVLSEKFIPKKDIDKRILYREIAGEYFKGFLPDEREKYGKNDKELKSRINWHYFKEVSQYPRHRRIYILLRVSPVLFRIYLFFESLIKRGTKK